MLADLLPSIPIQKLGWTLLHLLWQGAIIAGLLSVALSCLRNRSANSRYLVSCLALGLMAVTPVVTFLVLPEKPAEAISILKESKGLNGYTSWATALAGYLAEQMEKGFPWLIALWILGVGFMAGRLIEGLRRTHHLKSRHDELLEPFWLRRIQKLQKQMGIHRAVHLLQSSWVHVPAVIGWLQPAVLIPTGMLTGLSPEQVELILAHELAHIRRHDYLVNLLQRLVEIIFFYHPTVWWISARISIEREICCDELAVKMCGNRICYARALTALEEMRPESDGVVMAATEGDLFKRIRLLMGFPPDDVHMDWKRTLILVGMSFELVLAILVPIQTVANVTWGGENRHWEQTKVIENLEPITVTNEPVTKLQPGAKSTIQSYPIDQKVSENSKEQELFNLTNPAIESPDSLPEFSNNDTQETLDRIRAWKPSLIPKTGSDTDTEIVTTPESDNSNIPVPGIGESKESVSNDSQNSGAIISFEHVSQTVGDGDESVTFRVIRSGDTNSSIRVNYETRDALAIAGEDYESATGTLVFDPGEIEKSIEVNILNQNFFAERKYFRAFLTQMSGGDLGDPSQILVNSGPGLNLQVLDEWPGSGWNWGIIDVVTAGDYAYVTTGVTTVAGMTIFDLTDPTHPRILGRVDTFDYATGVAIAGDYAYLVHDCSGMAIIDISEKSDPQVISWFGRKEELFGVAVNGDQVYVTGLDEKGSGLLIVIDCSDPYNPETVSKIIFTDSNYGTIQLLGNYAYLSGDHNWSGSEFGIVDISDPTNLRLVGTALKGKMTHDMDAMAGYAYVALTDGVAIIDISDPSFPNVITTFPVNNLIQNLKAIDNYVLIDFMDGLLLVINVSDPLDPQQVAQIDRDGACKYGLWHSDIDIQNEQLVWTFTDFSRSGGLGVLDIGNPSHPRVVGIEKIGCFQDIAIQGNHAIIAVGGAGLSIIDFTDYCNMKRVARMETRANITRIVTSDHRAYLALDDSGFVIVDISNPAIPEIVGEFHTEWRIEDMAISNEYLYLATNKNGLQILDISNPTIPLNIGSYTFGESPIQEVEVYGEFAFLAVKKNGLHVIDINEPANPKLVSKYNGSDGQYNVLGIEEGRAYVAPDRAGVIAIDIVNPANLKALGDFTDLFFVKNLTVIDKQVYAIDSNSRIDTHGKIQIIDFANPENPKKIGSFGNGIKKISTVDNNAFLALGSTGVQLVKVNNPSEIQLITLDSTVGGVAIVIHNDIAYVGYGDHLRMLDISKNQALQLRDKIDICQWGYPGDIELIENRAYMIIEEFGFLIWDLSNSAMPQMVGSYDGREEDYDDFEPIDIEIHGEFAFLASGGRGIEIVDLSNYPPTQINKFGNEANATRAMCIKVRGNHAYVADYYRGLLIFDVNDFQNPKMVGEFSSEEIVGHSEGSLALDVYGDYAYLVNCGIGIVVIDVKTPGNPKYVSNCNFKWTTFGAMDALTYPQCIAINGNHLYAASGDGIHVFDISNPGIPKRIAKCSDFDAWGLKIDKGYIYAAGPYGMSVFPMFKAPLVMESQSENGVVYIKWSGGTLQSAGEITGPWQDESNAANPFHPDPGIRKQFFRLR